MSISSKSINNGKECVISISDKFVFRLYREFRQAYTNCDPTTKLITIDLKNTSYIDSSALGMMLLLKKYARENNLQVKMVNVARPILRAFEIVHLDKEFDIELAGEEPTKAPKQQHN